MNLSGDISANPNYYVDVIQSGSSFDGCPVGEIDAYVSFLVFRDNICVPRNWLVVLVFRSINIPGNII